MLLLVPVAAFSLVLSGCILVEDEDGEDSNTKKREGERQQYQHKKVAGQDDGDSKKNTVVTSHTTKQSRSESKGASLSANGSSKESGKASDKPNQSSGKIKGKCRAKRSLCRSSGSNGCRDNGIELKNGKKMCSFTGHEASCSMAKGTTKYLCSHLGNAKHPDVKLQEQVSRFGKKKSSPICKKNDAAGDVRDYYPSTPILGIDGQEKDPCAELFKQLDESKRTSQACAGFRVVGVKEYSDWKLKSKENRARGYAKGDKRKKVIDAGKSLNGVADPAHTANQKTYNRYDYYQSNGRPIVAWDSYKSHEYLKDAQWCIFTEVKASCDFVTENDPCAQHNNTNPPEDAQEACRSEESADGLKLCEWD